MLSTKRTYEFSQHVLLDWELLICSRTIMHSFFCRSQQKTQEEKEISVEFKIISQLRKKSKGKSKINLSQAKKLLEMQNKRDRIAKVCLLGPYSVKEGWFYLSLFKSHICWDCFVLAHYLMLWTGIEMQERKHFITYQMRLSRSYNEAML